MACTLPQLFKAIAAEQPQEVKRVLSYNPSLAHQKQARDGQTPLHAAAATGNLPTVRELLQGGASCQETDENLEVPLHIACRQRNGAAVVKELLSDAGRRSCLRAQNREGATPLHLAVQAGLLDVAQLLVNAGAKADAADRSGRTPHDYVDPRLPGLAELLESGRQLTPVKVAMIGGSGGGGGGCHNNNNNNKAAAPAAASPAKGRRLTGAAAAAASPSPGKAAKAVSTPNTAQRRRVGAVGQRAWDAAAGSPAKPLQQVARQAPKPGGGGGGGSAEQPPAGALKGARDSHDQNPAAGGEQNNSSSASLASPKPPRHNGPPAAVVVAAAAVAKAATQKQKQHVVLEQESSGAVQLLPAPRPAAAAAAGAPESAAAASEQQQQPQQAEVQQQHEEEPGGATDDTEGTAAAAAAAAAVEEAEPAAAATAAEIQPQPQQKEPEWGSAGGAAPAPAPEAPAATEITAAPEVQRPQQLQARSVRSSAASLSGLGQPVGALQVVPSAGAATTGLAAGAGGGAYCRGPLSLAQPNMQASSASLAGVAGGSTSSIGAHYQQLAAATMVCQQSLQQLQGNLSQLSIQKSSCSLPHAFAGGAAGMGPLRSGRVAVAAAAAAAAAAQDPSRASCEHPSLHQHPAHLPAVAAAGSAAVGSNSMGAAGQQQGGPTVWARRFSRSDNGVASGGGMVAGSNSWIVTPEASSGLLVGHTTNAASHSGGGGLIVAGSSHSGSSSVPAAAAGGGAGIGSLTASVEGRVALAAPAPAVDVGVPAEAVPVPRAAPAAAPRPAAAFAAATGPLSANHSSVSVAAPPALVARCSANSSSHHPMLAAAHQLQRQQQQLAGIAAAVATGSSVGAGGGGGPLQAPLMAQLGELSHKVSRLEEWFEAQVELIPDWQRALEVVQAVKRQSDDHGHQLTEHDCKLADQAAFMTELAGKLEGLQAWSQAAQGEHDQARAQLGQLEAGQVGLCDYLSSLEAHLQQLQDQLTQQEAGKGTLAAAGEAQVSSLVSQLDDTNARLDATAARMSTLEATAADAAQQLQEQQQAVAAATALAAAAADSAATATAAASASATTTSEDSAAGRRQSNSGSSSNNNNAQLAESLTKQVASLKLQFAELAATVGNMSRASRAAAAFTRKGGGSSEEREGMPVEEAHGEARQEVVGREQSQASREEDEEESWLPFMESTSACLAAHEQQIEALQAVVPKLEGVVSLRAQLINMAEQVAALQTAFNMMQGHRSGSGSGAAAAGVPPSPLSPLMMTPSAAAAAGPLGAHKAAADALNLATSMVKLQGQMGQLAAAVEALREEWEEAAAANRGEREAVRRDWEAERARIAAAEAEVARLLSEQQAEFAEREEQLIDIRAAAAEADDAARVAALESQQRLTGQLAALQAQQALMARQLAAQTAANADLRTELAAVQSKLAATAEAQAAMAEAQAAATAAAAAVAAANAAQAEEENDEQPEAREDQTPTKNPFPMNDAAADAMADAAAAAPTRAAAASQAEQQAGACVEPPNSELEVLGQQRLVSSSPFGPSYWGTAGGGGGSRHSSSNNSNGGGGGVGGCQQPAEGAKLTYVSPSAAAAAGLDGRHGRHTAAAGMGRAAAAAAQAAASSWSPTPDEDGADEASLYHAEQQQRRSMTSYDAVLGCGGDDRAPRSWGPEHHVCYSEPVPTALPAAPAAAGKGQQQQKVGWLAKMMGHGSSSSRQAKHGKTAGGSEDTAATGTDSSGAVAAAVQGSRGGKLSREQRKALAAAAKAAIAELKKQKQQERRASGGGATLLAKWSKQPRKAGAAAAAADAHPAAEAAGEVHSLYQGLSTWGDVRTGVANSDQLLPGCAAADPAAEEAAAGAFDGVTDTMYAAGASSTAAQQHQQSSRTWKRRLLG